jgi:hypothetical protein
LYNEAHDDKRERTHLLANLLALFQPTNVAEFDKQVTSLNRVLRFATRGWNARQLSLLEYLLRATIYEKGVAGTVAQRKNNCVVVLLDLARGDITHVCAATLFLYTGMRSKFDRVLCDDAQMTGNTMLRIVTTLLRSTDVEATVRDTCLSACQLWDLALALLTYLRNVGGDFDSIEFVQAFAQHVASTRLLAVEGGTRDQSHSITNALENNFV